MLKPTKYRTITAIILALGLFKSSTALSGDSIQQRVEARIASSEQLRDTRIGVHVEASLVILTGEVRLYEQKLISERLAWTTPGVFEVDNEIQVSPKLPLSDTAIERKIREIVHAHERFRAAAVVVKVANGMVRLHGSFLGYSDPSDLKHRVAEIEVVIGIEVSAWFLARLENRQYGVGVNSQRCFDGYVTSRSQPPGRLVLYYCGGSRDLTRLELIGA